MQTPNIDSVLVYGYRFGVKFPVWNAPTELRTLINISSRSSNRSRYRHYNNSNNYCYLISIRIMSIECEYWSDSSDKLTIVIYNAELLFRNTIQNTNTNPKKYFGWKDIKILFFCSCKITQCVRDRARVTGTTCWEKYISLLVFVCFILPRTRNLRRLNCQNIVPIFIPRPLPTMWSWWSGW